MKRTAPMVSPQARTTSAQYLAEGVKAFHACNLPHTPIWRKRIPAWMSRLDRTVCVELMRDFSLRVRDPKTNQILAESEPGKLDVLRPLTDLDQRPTESEFAPAIHGYAAHHPNVQNSPHS